MSEGPTQRPRPRLINHAAVRRVLLEEYAQWGHAKKRRRVSPAILEEIENAFYRFLVAQASQDLVGRTIKP